MDLKRDIRWGSVDWIVMAQDRDQWWVLVNMVMNFQVPHSVGKCFSGHATGGFSRAQLHGVN
jgi:hypothetical protein